MTMFEVKKQEGEDGQDQYTVVEDPGLLGWEADAPLKIVGRPHSRVEGAEKVTGRAQCSYDIRLPGQLQGRVLRSPHPQARVRRVDTSKAAALPGVRAVISAENTAEIPWYRDSFVFDRTVRFVGDEVAAVAADSGELADDALRLIEVDYEPLPFVLDVESALRPGAPKLHQDGNLAGEPKLEQRGDVEAGLREADVVVDRIYETQTALHNCMEPHGCVAS